MVSHLQGWNYTKGDFSPCERTTVYSGSDILFVACFIPLYEVVLHPLFNTCMPHIGTFKKFAIGVLLFFIRIAALLIIKEVMHTAYLLMKLISSYKYTDTVSSMLFLLDSFLSLISLAYCSPSAPDHFLVPSFSHV